MKFFLVLGETKLSLFDIENNYEPQFIDGASSFEYDIARAQRTINEIINELATEYNLEPAETDGKLGFYNQISFVVLGSSDKLVNKIVCDVLGDYVKSVYDVDQVLLNIFNTVLKQKNSMVEKYGVNYDGKNYQFIDGKMSIYEFNLLGYTIKNDILIEEVRKMN